MSYEYDPRELGRKGGDQPSSGNISELEQALGTEDCQQILFDFGTEESSDKHRNQDEELDIWKMIPGIASKYHFCKKKVRNSLVDVQQKRLLNTIFTIYLFSFRHNKYFCLKTPYHLALDKKLTNGGMPPPNVVISTEFCMIEAGECLVDNKVITR